MNLRQAEKRFRGDLARLKAFKGWSESDLAANIGCSESTIARLKREPCRCLAVHVLMIQEMLREEERKL